MTKEDVFKALTWRSHKINGKNAYVIGSSRFHCYGCYFSNFKGVILKDGTLVPFRNKKDIESVVVNLVLNQPQPSKLV